MRHMTVLIAGLATCTCLSCSSGSSSSTQTTSATELGTYALQSLNGNALPTTINDSGNLIEVSSGSLALTGGSAVSITTTFRSPPATGSIQTTTVTGTYSLQGSTLTFALTNHGVGAATLSGSSISMTNEGIVFLYRKQ